MDPTCIIAAVTFLVGNSISMAYHVKERQRDHFDYGTFTMLEPEYIRKDWSFRRENEPLAIAAGFINAFSWIFFSIPIIQCAVILSRGGARRVGIHAAIGVLVIAGCASEFLARLMHLGQSNWGSWLSSGFNLDHWASSSSFDGIGWKVLETSHLVSYGQILWIDSFEYLTLFGVLVLLYISVNSMPSDGPSISRALAGFGLFIGLFSLSDFVSGVLRLRDWGTFSLLTMLISIINRLVCLPVFLLVLGCQLPRAMSEHKQQASDRRVSSPGSRSRHWVDSNDANTADALEMVATSGN